MTKDDVTLCLDAGVDATNGTKVYVNDCLDLEVEEPENTVGQVWNIYDDETIALGNGQCLKIDSASYPGPGIRINSLNVYTWECSASEDEDSEDMLESE